MGNRLEIDIAEKGELTDQMILPLLLLPFIENSFSYIDNKNLEKNWINLEFQIQDDEFTMKLIHGKTIDCETASSGDEMLSKTIKRLDYFYAGNYELKTTIEPEIMMTSLKIKLDNPIQNEKTLYTEQLTYDAV
jgi:two-component system, LytTR family, sensor kinase